MKMSECRWCGVTHGLQCPSVKAIEYFESGTVKRVEFKTAADDYIPLTPWPVAPMPAPLTQTWGGATGIGAPMADHTIIVSGGNGPFIGAD